MRRMPFHSEIVSAPSQSTCYLLLTKAHGHDQFRPTGNTGAREMDVRTEAVPRNVIRGLVATLMPWEHSKNSQEAALLVLGNILDNALESTPDSVPDGDRSSAPDGTAAGGAVRPSATSCVLEGEAKAASKRRCNIKEALLEALVAQAPVAETEDGEDSDGLLDAGR